jgi:hypothetical protein
MKSRIENLNDLHLEIARLRVQRLEYENEFRQIPERIKAKFHVPVMIYHKVGDVLKSLIGADNKNEIGQDDRDWVTNIFRVGLPVLLNKYFFPRSGFLMKSVVAMVSQKAAKNVNKDSISDLIDKVTSWIKTPRPKRRRDPVLTDYGIPPDSETY